MPPALRDDTTLLTPWAQGEVFHVCIGDHGTELQLLWCGWLRFVPAGDLSQAPFLLRFHQLHVPTGPTSPHIAGTRRNAVCGSVELLLPRC